METNSVHRLMPQAPLSRASRFMDRMSARKGALDQETAVETASGAVSAQLPEASPAPETLSAAQAASVAEASNDSPSEPSFLDRYMRAFAAARQ